MDISLLEVIRLITTLIYTLILFKTITLFQYVHLCHRIKRFNIIIYTFLVCALAQSTILLWLHADWILNFFGHLHETKRTYMWATFNLAGAFTQLTFLLGLEIYLKWKGIDSRGKVCKRRRKDDLP